MSISVRNMNHDDINDVLEVETAYFNVKTKAGLLIPSNLSWGEADYNEAVSQNNQLALVAERTNKVVGALVYSRPSEDDFFDIIRMVAHPDLEKNYDIRKTLLGYMVAHAKNDIKRNTLRVYVHGDDLATMKFLAKTVGWKFKRLKDADDTYLYTSEQE